LDMKHPPTAVGGIQKEAYPFNRLDMKHPPTAVDGISTRNLPVLVGGV